MRSLLLPFALYLATPAFAQVPPPDSAAAPSMLPDPVREMIEVAIREGNPKTVDAVLHIARKAHPDALEEIRAIEAGYRQEQAAKKEEKEQLRIAELLNASVFDHWKGQLEIGASRATGNSDSLGLFGATNLTREGLRWRHKLTARADIQRNRGVTTTERVLAGWQPNFKFDERIYTFGLTQYEHDRFLGYSNRYTLGLGGGYGVIATERMKVDLEGGPALRHTDFVDGPDETRLAGRASLALDFKITPTLHFAQKGSVYLEQGDSSASSQTILDTKLIGDLKARFSYNIQYERDAPPGRDPVDTLSRATLVYSF